MKKKMIAPLKKNTLHKDEHTVTDASKGCCGGTPTTNTVACCKLDEDKKAAGETGCGCNTADNNSKKSSCC